MLTAEQQKYISILSIANSLSKACVENDISRDNHYFWLKSAEYKSEFEKKKFEAENHAEKISDLSLRLYHKALLVLEERLKNEKKEKTVDVIKIVQTLAENRMKTALDKEKLAIEIIEASKEKNNVKIRRVS